MPTQLGLQAKVNAKVGDPRIAPNGRVTGGKYRRSRCTFDFDPKNAESLPDNLRSAIERLKPHKAYLLELDGQGVKLNFFVGWFSEFNSRDVFNWKLLGDLADLRISLDIDFYGPDEFQKVDAEDED